MSLAQGMQPKTLVSLSCGSLEGNVLLTATRFLKVLVGVSIFCSVRGLMKNYSATFFFAIQFVRGHCFIFLNI